MFTPANQQSLTQDYALIHINSDTSGHLAAGVALNSLITSSTPVSVVDVAYTTGIPALPQLQNESSGGFTTTVNGSDAYVTAPNNSLYGYGHFVVSGVSIATIDGGTAVIGTDSTGLVNGNPNPVANYPLIQVEMSAMTSTAEAQIEYWMTQDNEAPAIQRLYHALLNRSGSAADLQYYSPLYLTAEQQAASADGVTYATSAQTFGHDSTLIQYFLNSSEFTSAHANISNTAFVNLLYTNELARSPSASELSFYVNQLDSGTSKATIVGYFVSGPEALLHQGAWVS